jgi:hypothetical protein
MKTFKLLLKNQSGVALMMVITTVVILTAVMADFTFETKINKIKSSNILDRAQARLLAEAGLNFSIVRMRLYKEAYNLLQTNKNAKSFVNTETLNLIWNLPFVYPIPELPNFSMNQKEMIKEFQKNTLLDGQLNVSIQNISTGMNLNLLRISSLMQLEDEAKKEQGTDTEEEISEEELAEYKIENQLINSLRKNIELTRETDEEFFARNAGLELNELIGVMKYFLSDPESYMDDYVAISQGKFQEINQIPKFSPFSSVSELYLLPGWTDELIDLIINEFSVHGSVMIDLNKITAKMLKMLIPNINEDEIREFFEYRDKPEDPHYFNDLKDFQDYIVTTANLMSTEEFDDRFNKFEKAGMKFGPAPSLFKIVSAGIKGRATYKLTAYVILPARPAPIQNPQTTKPPTPNPPSDTEPPESTPPETNPVKPTEQPTQLMEPKIIEIFVN